MRLHFGCGRQLGLQARDDGVDALQRQNHIAAPVEEKIDLRVPAAGDRRDFLEAGDAVDGFLERPGDRHQHLVNRHHAVVYANNDAREIRVGKNRHGNTEGEIRANQRECHCQEQNRARQLLEPRCGWLPSIAPRIRHFRPKLHGHLLLALLGGFRVSSLMVFFFCALLISGFFFFRGGSFDFDLGVVR